MGGYMRRVVLDDGAIRRLMRDPVLRAQFPFLQPSKRSGRRSCCGAPTVAEPANLKSAIIGLPPERLAIIKKALSADSLEIYVSGTRVVV